VRPGDVIVGDGDGVVVTPSGDVADVAGRTSTLVRTGTKMNHDVTCSSSGVIAFRAQVDQWDQVYLAKLKD